MFHRIRYSKRIFQSTLPVRGATHAFRNPDSRQAISIHAPREGSDQYRCAGSRYRTDFNPRSPWGERLWRISDLSFSGNFNPRSPWGERHGDGQRGAIGVDISIHAPRGGSDVLIPQTARGATHFNPRSPWGERPIPWTVSSGRSRFQSTLPVGGATSDFNRFGQMANHFNPRSPWGERLGGNQGRSTGGVISIHAPRGGSDCLPKNSSSAHSRFQSTLPVGGATPSSRLCGFAYLQFQSTLPVGGATHRIGFSSGSQPISIHAPRGGSDLIFIPKTGVTSDFNPRSPWGERHCQFAGGLQTNLFQSTLPVGGATLPSLVLLDSVLFQSTLPVGGATLPHRLQYRPDFISIHAPRGGSDRRLLDSRLCRCDFNPRSPWGERPGSCWPRHT